MTLGVALEFMHVLAGIVWLGGGTLLILMGWVLGLGSDSSRFMAVVRQVDLVAPRVFVPATMVVLLTGPGPHLAGRLCLVGPDRPGAGGDRVHGPLRGAGPGSDGRARGGDGPGGGDAAALPNGRQVLNWPSSTMSSGSASSF
jgi:hypothetical protein